MSHTFDFDELAEANEREEPQQMSEDGTACVQVNASDLETNHNAMKIDRMTQIRCASFSRFARTINSIMDVCKKIICCYSFLYAHWLRLSVPIELKS